MPAQDGVPGGGPDRAVLTELLDRFHSLIGGAVDEARPRGGGPDPVSQWTAAERVEGPPLCSVVEVLGPLPLDAVAALALGILAELTRLHAAGSVHRQLTPPNVLLSESGPRLVHSGIARTVDGATLTDLDGTPLTLAYLTPEQVLGQPTGPETDVFALGGVLAFAATGIPPFGSDEPLSVLYRIVNEEPVLDTVPNALRGLVKACLRKDPAQRPTLQTLTDRAMGVLRDARRTQGQATDASVEQIEALTQTQLPPPIEEPPAPARLVTATPSIPVTRRRAQPRPRNVTVLATVVIVGVAAAFLVRAVVESSAPPPAPSANPSILTTVTATAAATATATNGNPLSAPLPGTFATGLGCPTSPWASVTPAITPAGALANVGGGPADCGGQAIAFLKTGVTAPGASSVAWTFRLGRSARCSLSVFIADTDASSGYAHYRLAIPASNATTVIFQINQSAAKGRFVAAPELAGLSLPDGSLQLVLTDAAAYTGDRFHVTASAVRASCTPAT